MAELSLSVLLPGIYTTIQDSGRWGFQGKGMPVSGAVDIQAFKCGNILVGNEENEAALEITITGPTLLVDEGEGIAAVTGADAGLLVNGTCHPSWHSVKIVKGDIISFAPPKCGCRYYLCLTGGIDVPLVMGSRSTYLRAGIGGLSGRALKKGDRLTCGIQLPLWRRCEGFFCPEEIRPDYSPLDYIRVVPGPQEDHFTPEGIETFYSSEYTITANADRMGYRLEGPEITHVKGADILSDAIPLGAVQVPGHGMPIVMLAERQTTGGYTKIGVVCSKDIAAIAQRMPGQKIRFKKISLVEAISLAREDITRRQMLRRSLAAYRSHSQTISIDEHSKLPINHSGSYILRINGGSFLVSWEEL